ncbi:MAG: membrane protein insertase YidC [Candidatus Eremiobacteraeota bacterium]|nr:membrane protein insertase YidC [Candidatus Eremiobacteraeota bacterium]
MHVLLASNWFFDPIVNFLSTIVLAINAVVHNLGFSLILLAGLIRLVFWPLNTAQFKSMLAMQKLSPQVKALQTRYKDDPQRLQQEQMKLFKENGANPLAGCWPMLVQYPVIISVYYVVMNHRDLFANQTFLWIGSAISAAAAKLTLFGQPILAQSLAHADLILVVLYAASMYFSVRFGSVPSTDPQQAQMQRSMSVISPLMLGFLGWRYQWPSAMVLYWFAYNLLTMGQTFYLLRRYHEPLSFVDAGHVITEDVPAGVLTNGAKSKSTSSPAKDGAVGGGQQRQRSNSGRSKKKNKKGS